MGSQKQGQILKIVGSMTVAEATALKDELINHFDASGSFHIDLSEVEACDIAGLQLLISAHKSAEASGKPLVFSGISDAVTNTFSRAGIKPDKILNNIEEA